MRNTIIFIIILVAGIFIFYTVFNTTKPQPAEVPISEVITLSESSQIKGISIDGDKLTVTKTDGTQIVTYKESNATLADYTKLDWSLQALKSPVPIIQASTGAVF